jgi:hypothetical protein
LAVQLLHHRRLPRSLPTYLVIWCLLAAPTLWDMIGTQSTLARFDVVGSTNPLHWLGTFLQHLGPDFLFFTGDANRRHHTGEGGMLNLALLPLLMAGTIFLLRRALQRDTFCIFLALFTVTCLIPVSLTEENLPHALRSLPALLPLTMVLILGYADLERRLHTHRSVAASAAAACLLLGVWGIYHSVVQMHRVADQGDRSIWSYYADEYVLSGSYVSPADHRAISIDERYERVALQGDLIYCCGEAKEQELMETIASMDSAAASTPGSLAHRHRQFYAIALARNGRQSEALARIRQLYDGEQVGESDANDIAVHWEWQQLARVFARKAEARGDSVEAQRFLEESLLALKQLATWVRGYWLEREFAIVYGEMEYDNLDTHRKSLSHYVHSFGAEEDPVAGMATIGDRYASEGKPKLSALAYQTIIDSFASLTAKQYTIIGKRLFKVGSRAASSEAYRMAIASDASWTGAHEYLGWNLIIAGDDEVPSDTWSVPVRNSHPPAPCTI